MMRHTLVATFLAILVLLPTQTPAQPTPHNTLSATEHQTLLRMLGDPKQLKAYTFADQKKLLKLATVYEWLNQNSDPAQPLDTASFPLLFTPDFALYANGQSLALSYGDLETYLQSLRNNPQFSVHHLFPFEDIVMDKHGLKMAMRHKVRFRISMTQNFEKELTTLSIAHLAPDGRFKRIDTIVSLDAQQPMTSMSSPNHLDNMQGLEALQGLDLNSLNTLQELNNFNALKNFKP